MASRTPVRNPSGFSSSGPAGHRILRTVVPTGTSHVKASRETASLPGARISEVLNPDISSLLTDVHHRPATPGSPGATGRSPAPFRSPVPRPAGISPASGAATRGCRARSPIRARLPHSGSAVRPLFLYAGSDERALSSKWHFQSVRYLRQLVYAMKDPFDHACLTILNHSGTDHYDIYI